MKADEFEDGPTWTDRQIVEALETSLNNVSRPRKRPVEQGFEAVLTRQYNPACSRPKIFDGDAEAKLIAIACSKPPDGRAHWTLRLLEEKVVELGIVERASDNTIGRILKKHPQAAPQERMGHSARRQCRLRRVHGGWSRRLPASARPKTARVCLDETSKQLTIETRAPVVAAPGRPARHEYEYEGNGTAALFMIFAPLEDRRRVEVRERRTAVDYAHVLMEIADVEFCNAEKIVLVQNNLNTHKPASALPGFSCRRSAPPRQTLRRHYTSKHGSWLDMTESELSVLSSQCLDRRIRNIESLTPRSSPGPGNETPKP